MAKKATIERNKKRQKLIAKYAKKRQQLKEAGDWQGLAKLPPNSSPSRHVNRCRETGRSRGYIRRFGVSRIVFRERASKGEIPGITKSSW